MSSVSSMSKSAQSRPADTATSVAGDGLFVSPWTEAVSVPRRISLVSAAVPGNLAVSDDSGSLSYGELDERTNRLASYFRTLGVGPEVLVAMCVSRSITFVLASLAIIKAGGAYLPMDPTLPADRLKFMLNDAAVTLLLTHGSQDIPSGTWKVIDLDRVYEQISEIPPSLALPDVQPDNLAYVIYTSGSTGLPKGVEITHASLKNLINWHHRTFEVTSADRASMLANVGFDASVWELWPYLTAGASVHLPDESTRNIPERLQEWIASSKLTIAFVPTPLAERLMALKWPANGLRRLLTGGDVLHHYPPADLPFKVINNYGPTEYTVVATSSEVINKSSKGMPSIGLAIDNTQVRILDSEMRPVPIGVAGELYIGGAGLARGYRNRPDLTEAKFVSTLFNAGQEVRLYKTGDLVRMRPDGTLDFLGRIDDQMKIRGHRIEPNEVVMALNQHPLVDSSFVLPQEDSRNEKRIVAYIVRAPASKPNALGLREFLRNRLPDYMIPEVFVALDEMPTSTNGKIDRDALPLPDPNNILHEQTYVSPRGGIENRVAGILAELLEVERVGADDNFFLMGGHSLLGAQLISRVREVFGVNLTLINLFESPTVTNLANEIERLIALKAQPKDREKPLDKQHADW